MRAFLKPFGKKKLLPPKILEPTMCGLGQQGAVASLLEDRVSQSGMGTGRVPSETGVSKSPRVHGGGNVWGPRVVPGVCQAGAGCSHVCVCGASPPGLGPSVGVALPRGPGQVHIPTPSLPGSMGS